MTSTLATLNGLRRNRWTTRLLFVALIGAFLLALATRLGGSADASKRYLMPQDARMESSLGVRFTQAALVGDGGIIELRYVVLDTQKATTFQNNVQHPPVLYSDADRKNPLYRTALMKQGHNLRPGQSYYVLYLNNHNAVHKGGTLEIDSGGGKLVHVPVR
jgi:hypothetical protein